MLAQRVRVMFEMFVFGDVALLDCWDCWRRSCDRRFANDEIYKSPEERIFVGSTYLQTPINSCEPSGLKFMLVSEPSEHFDLYSKFHINSRP